MTKPTENLINIFRVMALTGLSRPRLTQLIRLRLFPPPIKVSDRLWSESDVIDWQRANRPDKGIKRRKRKTST